MSDRWIADKFPAFADAIGEYRCTGPDRGKGRCPNHARHRSGDKHHSLAFSIADNGGLTFACMTGCKKDEILAAAGLTWKDVCVDKPGYDAAAGDRKPRGGGRRLISTYPYRHEDGHTEFEVCRYFPKDFRPRRRMPVAGYEAEWCYTLLAGAVVRVPDEHEPSGHKWVRAGRDQPGAVEIGAVRPTLYNQDILHYLPPADKIVLFVEGEKAANALTSLGFVATTIQGGSNNRVWHKEWSKLFKGRTVIVLPDNDLPGMEYAAWVSGCLVMSGCAGVSAFRLPGLKTKGDSDDWLFAHRENEKDAGPNSNLAKKFRDVLRGCTLYKPVKLKDAYDPPEKRAKPPEKAGHPAPALRE